MALQPRHTVMLFQEIHDVVERARASARYRATALRERIPLLRSGDAMTMWARTVLNERMRATVTALDPERLDAVEVSGSWWSDQPWKSYESTIYPEFDLVAPPGDFQGWGQADVVICEQVLEHVVDPLRALRHLVLLARPGGIVLVNTPFLVKIHGAPDDYWRFTPAGLSELMRSSGLVDVEVSSWGNRRCVKANLRRWAPHHRWRTLKNEADAPVVVWGKGVRPRRGATSIP